MNLADISRYAGSVAIAAKFTDQEIDTIMNAKSEIDIPPELMRKIAAAHKRKASRLKGQYLRNR